MSMLWTYSQRIALMTSHLETSQVSEQAAEYGIIDSLARSPFYRVRQSSAFDAATLLDVVETTAFIKATQPRQWDKLSKQFAGEEDTALAGHLTPFVHFPTSFRPGKSLRFYQGQEWSFPGSLYGLL